MGIFRMTEENRDIWSSHLFWMVLCCLIPLAGITLLSFLGIIGPWGLYALILLCPLLHFIFMRRMVSKEMNSPPAFHRKTGGVEQREEDLTNPEGEAERRS